MKACSRIFLFLTVFILILIPSIIQAADYITPVKTPEDATLKWATRIGEGWQKSAGVPVLVDNSIVIISGDELLRLDKESGNITQRATMTEAQSYGYVAPTYSDDKLFMNLSNGTVQAFDAETFESEWIYKDALGGKGMTAVTWSDKVIYTGFWHAETKDANFVALDSDSGELLWSKTVNGGFYWTGAYCTDTAVIFGCDDGSDKIAHIYSCDKKTGEVLSCLDIADKGDIRSTVTYYNGRIYVTTKGGYIISAELINGVLSDVNYGEIGAASTSTPIIYNERIYIGAADKTISVFDASTLDKLFSIPVTAYPQCSPLISTHFTDNGYIYLYTTYNKSPGGVTLIKIKTDAKSVDDCIVTELFDAKGYEQYCISDIICDDSGTLYYKNDTGYLFALSDKITVKAALAEEGFIFPPKDITVSKNTAETYGYTDTVTDGISTLDVLVKIHEEMLSEDFNYQSAEDYLIVSEEGFLSRIMGIDTYSFGFAVNGKAPHDDILTEYGYTGYSLNQASVKNGDKVEFFIYRDSWAMDTYCYFSYNAADTDFIATNKGEIIEIKLKGYPFGWYSCYEESSIENMIFPVSDAKILLNEEHIATTDENGIFSLAFDSVGKYTISVREGDNATFIIPTQLEIDVLGAEIKEENGKTYLASNLTEETNVLIITATYDKDVMTSSRLDRVTLPKGYCKTEINTPDTYEAIKYFVWNKDMMPLIGGVTK